jgi:hypothetical protein
MSPQKSKPLSFAMFKRKQLKNRVIKKEYDALEEEFGQLQKHIEAELKAKRAKKRTQNPKSPESWSR